MSTTRRRPRRTANVPKIVRKLCGLVAELEGIFVGRNFTLDGHLVGSIGEVLAADQYGLTLLSMCEKTHDARASNGTLVQIKTTQCNSVGLRSEPDHLLVLKLDEQGCITEVYNGPGKLAWDAASGMQKSGQRAIGVAKLLSLMQGVPARARLRATVRG